MTTGVGARIAALETRFRPRGCPVCRHWCHAVVIDGRGERSRPETCPNCMRRAPATTTVILERVDWRGV
jgi:hypothetical protein